MATKANFNFFFLLILLFIGFFWLLFIATPLVSFTYSESQESTAESIAVIMCGQPTVQFAHQLSDAVKNYRGTVDIFFDDRRTRSVPSANTNINIYSCLGRTYNQHVKKNTNININYEYVVLLVASPSSFIPSPQTLFQDIAKRMKTADVIGISSSIMVKKNNQNQDSDLVYTIENTADDTTWWDTGRPILDTADAYSDAFNHNEWEASYKPKTRRSLLFTTENIDHPCWLLRRSDWTLNIVPSPTLSHCEAMGSTFVIKSNVLNLVADVLWPPNSKLHLRSASSNSISDLDIGLLHIWITLKRRFHRKLNIQHIGGLITTATPVSMFDKHSTDTWFEANEATRKNKDTFRQQEAVKHLSYLHDMKEILSPNNNLLDIGCSSKGSRCSLQFVQRGLSLPPCCKKKLIALLKFISGLLTKNNILHWIDYGTLLGAVRHQGKFVPWEYDADVTVWSGHWENVLNLQTTINEEGHFFLLQQPGYGRVFTSEHNGVYLDLYSAGSIPHHDPNNWYLISGGNIDPFPVSFLRPMSSIYLEGLYLPAPNHAAEFLKTRYGPSYMNVQKKKIYDGPISRVDPKKFGPDPLDFTKK